MSKYHVNASTSKDDIHHIFWTLHAEYVSLGKIPIPITEICDKMNITINREQLQEEYDGNIKVDNDNFIITINTVKRSVQRQFFTLAHEIGHLLNDKNKLVEEKMICDRKDDYSNIEKTKRAEIIKMERLANIRAAEILMPEDVFTKYFIHKSYKYTKESIAKIFGVSVMAVSVRANELGLSIL
ncbi:ImmA/IrrE family metallo-endopeptidase [Candidatus Deianiraea vastatrix]|uniref:ImmA/IrrE family metallo-endopeptidase n=1 Tax=Candidatus Deianiraea vastatrix TaxID=2163644 RepID=A0A5B8XC16_9RICK|nr:ImmA/IrrE family metallo-endopeptidase [Candidatus Deianiraea vastatrix]QED22893.1 Putative ImmA/IrrE family metallo-endopeptidase [Candidatus Deianiraea vastatrix]